MIYKIVDIKENKYAPIAPNKLMDLISEKETKLKNILPALNSQFEKNDTKQAVYVYKGIEGFKTKSS